MEQVEKLVSTYEQFTFTSLKTGQTRQVAQYPTYYAGCCLWGRIDLALGKERLFETLGRFDGFPDAWKVSFLDIIQTSCLSQKWGSRHEV